MIPLAPPTEFVVLAPGAALYPTATATEPFAVLPDREPLYAARLGEEGGRVHVATQPWAEGHCTTHLASRAAELALYVDPVDLLPVVAERATWEGEGRSVSLAAGVPLVDGAAWLPEGLRVEAPFEATAIATRYRPAPPPERSARALPDLVLPAGTVIDLGGAVLTAPAEVVMTGSRLASTLQTRCAEIVAPGVGLDSAVATGPEPVGSGVIGMIVGPLPARVPEGTPAYDLAGHRIGSVDFLREEALSPHSSGRQCAPIELGGGRPAAAATICVDAEQQD